MSKLSIYKHIDASKAITPDLESVTESEKAEMKATIKTFLELFKKQHS